LANKMRWDDQISPKLDHADKRGVDDFLRSVVQLHAPRVETSARRNAKWHDRTGNARSGLRGIPDSKPGGPYKIILAHGVPYGIYLEVRWSDGWGSSIRLLTRARSHAHRINGLSKFFT
jgi:hypothetical protein